MKKQNFYPKQVMKRLRGRDVETFDEGERSALSFFMRRGRKYGMSIGVLNEAKAEDLLKATSRALAESILENATSKVFLKVS